MENVSSELVGDLLILAGKKMKAGKCSMSQEQMDALFAEIEKAVDIPISKEQACGLLGVSRSTFDARVAAGEIPSGQHRRGFKEKVWYKRDITKHQ